MEKNNIRIRSRRESLAVVHFEGLVHHRQLSVHIAAVVVAVGHVLLPANNLQVLQLCVDLADEGFYLDHHELHYLQLSVSRQLELLGELTLVVLLQVLAQTVPELSQFLERRERSGGLCELYQSAHRVGIAAIDPELLGDLKVFNLSKVG
jgi:hypothetical protein